MKSTIVAGLMAASLVLAGCASRPSQQELTDAILVATAARPEIEVTPTEASCIASALLNSDLSDTTLNGLAEDFDNPQVLDAEIDRVAPLIAEAASACRP